MLAKERAMSRLEEALRLVEQLSEEDRAQLLRVLKDSQRGPLLRLADLYGLGRELWQHLDAQEYVNLERASWGN
jgi:hypothetical protein